MSAIGVGSGGDESFDLDATLSWDGIEVDEVERDVLDEPLNVGLHLRLTQRETAEASFVKNLECG
ncbi:hypothetical protein FACS1894116_09120 [Betaproteobacteria bacterium]|nr:hypothetical protein FACS1894116_09120 [Betaproteobacteria bacterium]GHT99654.1 hypothetical protein FACS1894154_07150 [Betaproteobacteria bacterium]GHU24371.1 hypothetical protein FACS189488_08860 [Betaproteobacteria bacterium]